MKKSSTLKKDIKRKIKPLANNKGGHSLCTPGPLPEAPQPG